MGSNPTPRTNPHSYPITEEVHPIAEEEKITINIRRSIYEKAKKYIEETGGFDSVEEFIEFIVEEALEATGETLSEEDKRKVEERLKDLGYM